MNREGKNRAQKIQVPLYLPQKLSKKTGKINGNNYKQKVLDYLETGEAYRVELIKRDGKIHVHITIDEAKIVDYRQIHTTSNGVIGVDTNPDGFALTILDENLNYIDSTYLREHELLYARSNRRDNLCGELAKKAVEIAKENGVALVIEDLNFKRDKDVKSKFARISHQFAYSRLLESLETKAKREGVEIIRVKPQYTSKIGLYKYSHQYGLNAHESAALVIGRRAIKSRERVPKLLKDKLLTEKERTEFDNENNWRQWSIIARKIKGKGGEKPGLWQRNRKSILGIV